MRTVVSGLGVAALLTGSLAAAEPSAPDDVPFPSAVEPEEDPIPAAGPPAAPQPDLLRAPLKEGGAAAEAPAQPAVDGPRTGFEERGGSSWTTLEEEQSFLREVDDLSDRVSISRAGTTLEGRPMDLVQIGAEPRTKGEVAAGSSVLFACTQHGNEPAGRESCLQLIRDLALDNSPATRRLLDRSTILVIPTVNPDGVAANTRGNSEGVDINRDHLALQTKEAQALAQVLLDYDSQVVHDAHEYSGRADVYERDLIRLWPRHLNVNQGIHDLAVELAEDYIDPTVEYEDFTTGDYGIWYDAGGRQIAQVAGNEDERIMRNTMGLKHRVGQLTESRVNDFSGEESQTENNIRRVRTHLLANQSTLDLMLEQGSAIKAATADAREAATEAGASGDQPYSFAGADNALPPRTPSTSHHRAPTT
ncbi:M14 family metallopeptidase [Ornithinicoccus hortensis]|uniref:M14 family metallopeptidase n=1 Tax=Ornithinicoccus hortensis TaxID=82346 RepID=UPI00114F375F|nr:M14 family metallocarboxypeptidase [Ornithinicoccus hortensis]